MIPPWLARHLADANPDGCTRQLRAAVCRRCGARVLRGLDDDTCALPATVDPHPVNEVGELLAVLAGAATYDITLSSHRADLTHRDPSRLRRRTRPVLADHRCGTTWPTAPTPTATTATEDTDEPRY